MSHIVPGRIKVNLPLLRFVETWLGTIGAISLTIENRWIGSNLLLRL